MSGTVAAQSTAPVALPNTMTTLAGTSPMAATAGTQCPNLPTGVVSTDAYGDGCLAVNGIFGSGARGGVQVDQYGYVFIQDDINGVMHMINPTNGIMTVAAGKGTVCATPTKLDTPGDGCIAATQTVLSGQRGMGLDYWGNILSAGYSDNLIHIICRFASPNCTTAQIGTMQLIAGCSAGTGSNGTGGAGVDNKIAKTTVAGTCTTSLGEVDSPRSATGDQYGNVYFADTASSRFRVVLGPQTSSYFTGTNPLYAALGVYYASLTAGYTYTIINVGGTTTYVGGTQTSIGATCSVTTNAVTYSGTALSQFGDGCPFGLSSLVGNSGYTNTVAVDGAGNMLFTDPLNGLRVFFVSASGTAGAAMSAAITANNSSVTTPATGFVYSLAGFEGGATATATITSGAVTGITITNGGSGYTAAPTVTVLGSAGSGFSGTATISGGQVTGVSVTAGGSLYANATVYITGGSTTTLGSTPTLGSTTSGFDSAITKMAVSPQGNIYIGDQTRVLFYDINTGYVRTLFTAAGSNPAAGSYCTGTSGQKSLSAYGDGCVAGLTKFGNSNSMGVSVDDQGNLYVQDNNTTVPTVRKVLAQGTFPGTLGITQIQNYKLHFYESGAGTVGTPASTTTTDSDITSTSVACGTQNADNSVDCTTTVTEAPVTPGLRSAALSTSVAVSGSTTPAIMETSLAGMVTGSVLATDASASNGTAITPTINSVFSGITPVGAAVDGAGNVYTMNTGSTNILESIGGTTFTLASALPTTPLALAVDPLGDVFAVGSGSSTITELQVTGAPSSAGQPAALTSTTVSYTPLGGGTAVPKAIAADQFGNIYVADKQSLAANTAVYRISLSPHNGSPQATLATGFTNPVGLAVDYLGNVYVADSSAGKVYKLAPPAGSSPTYTQTTVTLGTSSPVALATDPGGDLYVLDSAAKTIVEVPGSQLALSTSSTSFTTAVVLASTIAATANGLAVDGRGNVYVADSANTSVEQVVRTGVAFSFGTGSSGSPTYTGTITDVGNQASTGQPSAASSPNITVTSSSTGCTFAGSATNYLEGAQPIGTACAITANMTGSGSSTVTDTISYQPASSTLGSLVLSGTLQGTSYGTTTTISGQTPSSPSYASSATEVTFTVTVAAATGTTAPGGTVGVTVINTATNATTTNNYPLTASGANGVATVTLAGYVAGSYTIAATYPTTGSFTSSAAGATGFSIAQDTTVTTWTPGVSSVSYSAPVGTAALNASATFNSAAVPGVFVYTANGVEINAATYLAIGSYTLGVTFYPTDATDYTSSTANGGTFSVVQATTTAPIGGTQNLVAADGTGNFTSVQSALTSLPATGGKVYVKPGTYSGFITVVTPNTSIYGLGGNPSNVILTNEDGAFSPSYLAGQGPGNNSHTGDEGSATMVIARDAIMNYNGGAMTTPTNFYGENFSIINTYDTDNSNQQYNQYINNSCTTVMTPLSNFTLFNGAGTPASPGLCNSQALAIWMTGDQLVLNNVYVASLQDTIFAGAVSSSSAYAARQYWFRGKVTGNVDYIFGDAALVFDHTSIFSAFHGTAASGEVTIEAQDKYTQTGSAGDYLSGYIMNSDVFTSQAPNMTSLYFGRPYGPGNQNSYSTWVMLNSYIDQVAAAGYVEFTPGTTHSLPLSTYVEYNNHTYTDPAPNSNDLNGVPYAGAGGNTGSGVTSTRETQSANPGTPEVASNGFQTNYPALANTTLSQIEAQQYYPIAFLGTTVASNPYNNGVTNWNPTTAIATGANAFVPSSSPSSITYGQSITLLMRPQTPGQGAVANGVYTIPTGTYIATENGNTIASGTLDASGSAYVTLSNLTPGVHNFKWTYSGDSNFAGSTTSTPYSLTVNGSAAATTTSLAATPSPATYGQTVTLTATVLSNSSPVTTGTVTFTVDGATVSSFVALNGSGQASYNATGLAVGPHSFTATYNGNASYNTSFSGTATDAVNQAPLIITAGCNNRIFGAANVCSAGVSGYKYSDSAATVFTSAPTATTTALRNSPANTYTASVGTYTLSTLGSTNYTVSAQTSTFVISGGAPQSIMFAALPNFASGGSYQLTAFATSGLPVTYTVTAGSANISNGTTLNVTGPGLVTVQATQTVDPTGDYAAATPVSRSFTAQ